MPALTKSTDLGLLRSSIESLLHTNHPVLQTVTKYYFQTEGKAIRPLLVLLMSQATNSTKTKDIISARPKNTIGLGLDSVAKFNLEEKRENILITQLKLAEITELIHTASLLHDDVIDESDMRRKLPSINSLYGNKMAVLAGDFLLARASVSLSSLENHLVSELLSTSISNLVEGEFMQLRKSDAIYVFPLPSQLDVTIESNPDFQYYLTKSYLKTASLIAKSLHAATALSHSEMSVQLAAYNYGMNLGMAFQIIDDTLDFTGTTLMGKPLNVDLSLGLATAPVLYAKQEFPELSRMIDRKFKEDGDVKRGRDLVMQSKGIEKSRRLAETYLEMARKELDTFTDSKAKAFLIQLSHSLLTRTS